MRRRHEIHGSCALLLGAALVASSLVPSSACAQEAEPQLDFESIVARAVEHYGAREYAPAIELFEQAFALRPEPDLVYNIARSYERMARVDEAIREYERFIGMAGTTAELRSRALTALQALRAEQRSLERQQEREAELAATPPAPVVEPAPPPPPAVSPRSNALEIAGWTTLGIGLAAVGVGIGFGGLALDRNDAFERALPRSDMQIALRDDVRRYALIADVLLIGGGVLGLTGIVMLIVDAGESGGETQASGDPNVTFVAGPGSVGLSIDGAF